MSLTIHPARIIEESNSPLLRAPESWPRRPLGEMATILNGYAFKSNQFAISGGVPLIRIRDIFKKETSVGYVGSYDERYLVHRGDLLVGMDGDFNCTPWAGPEGLLNQRVCKIAPDPDLLDIDYLTHVLPAYLRAIHDATSSTTVTHLSSRDIAQIPIPAPQLRIQRRLVALMDSVSAGSASCHSHISVAKETIERFRQAVISAACLGQLTETWRESHNHASAQVLLELLTSSVAAGGKRRPDASGIPPDVELPGGWVWTRLSTIADSIDYGYTASATKEPEGPQMLRITDIQDGVVDWGHVPHCAIDDAKLERYKLQQEDLVFARTGATTGKSFLLRDVPPHAVFASYLIRVRLLAPVNCKYVDTFFQSPWYWRQIIDSSVGTGQPNCNGTKLASLWVPLPGEEEQREIVRRVDQLLTLADCVLDRINIAQRAGYRIPQTALAKSLDSPE